MLNAHILQYLKKKRFHQAATAFANEAPLPDESQINSPTGFLWEWWSVFWDIYRARQKTPCSPEAKKYVELKRQQVMSMMFPNAMVRANGALYGPTYYQAGDKNMPEGHPGAPGRTGYAYANAQYRRVPGQPNWPRSGSHDNVAGYSPPYFHRQVGRPMHPHPGAPGMPKRGEDPSKMSGAKKETKSETTTKGKKGKKASAKDKGVSAKVSRNAAVSGRVNPPAQDYGVNAFKGPTFNRTPPEHYNAQMGTNWQTTPSFVGGYGAMATRPGTQKGQGGNSKVDGNQAKDSKSNAKAKTTRGRQGSYGAGAAKKQDNGQKGPEMTKMQHKTRSNTTYSNHEQQPAAPPKTTTSRNTGAKELVFHMANNTSGRGGRGGSTRKGSKRGRVPNRVAQNMNRGGYAEFEVNKRQKHVHPTPQTNGQTRGAQPQAIPRGGGYMPNPSTGVFYQGRPQHQQWLFHQQTNSHTGQHAASVTHHSMPHQGHPQHPSPMGQHPQGHPQHPSPHGHPQHPSPIGQGHPQHASPMGHPQHASPMGHPSAMAHHPQHASPMGTGVMGHPQHASPMGHPQHASPMGHPQHASPMGHPQHASPMGHPQHASPMGHPQHGSQMGHPSHPSPAGVRGPGTPGNVMTPTGTPGGSESFLRSSADQPFNNFTNAQAPSEETSDPSGMLSDFSEILAGAEQQEGAQLPYDIKLLCDVGSHKDKVLTSCFDKTATKLLTAGRERVIYVWNVPSSLSNATMQGAPMQTLKGHNQDFISELKSAISQSGRSIVASASMDFSIRIWDIGGDSRARVLHLRREAEVNYPTSIDFHPTMTQTLVSAHASGHLRFWNLANSAQVCELEDVAKNIVSFQPKTGTFIACGFNNQVNVVNNDSKEIVFTLSGHEKIIVAITWNRAGDRLCSVSADSVRIWDIKAQRSGRKLKPIATFNGNGLSAAVFHPKYEQTVIIGSFKELTIWNYSSNKKKRKEGMHTSTISSLSTVIKSETNDGRGEATYLLASTCTDKTVKLWTLT